MDTMTVDAQALTLKIDDNAIATWSDEKKKDFIRLFGERARAARYIYYATSQYIIERGQAKKYISRRTADEFDRAHSSNCTNELFDPRPEPMTAWEWNAAKTIGGRPIAELQTIAIERADAILKELPSIRKAMAIIQPEVARKMDKRDALFKEGQALCEELEKFSYKLKLSEMDKSMTIGEFLEKAHDQEKARNEIIDQLDVIGDKGNDLEEEINRALFDGIPEISEAVVKVAHEHYERGIFFGQVTRRAEERILFGDSKEAMDLLSHFEKDEVKVADTIKASFVDALDKLKLRGKASREALKEAKKKGAE